MQPEQYKQILLVGGSVQNLRHMIAQHLNIDSKTIKFTQTGEVFINDISANCWGVHDGFFVYYEPTIAEHRTFDPAIHEIILLTSYTTAELKLMIALNMGCQPDDVELDDDGSVYVRGEYALSWRLMDNKYFEYYAPVE